MDRNLRAYQTHRVLAFIYGVGTFGYALFAHFRPHWLTPELRIFGTLVPLLFVIHVLAASGSVRLKPWARMVSLVMGVLLTLAFPIGTVFGLFLLFVAPFPHSRPLLLADPAGRRSPADRHVPPLELLEQVRGRGRAAPDVRVVRLDLVEPIGRAIGHEQDGVAGHREAPWAWTRRPAEVSGWVSCL